jgi:hypothetical protein
MIFSVQRFLEDYLTGRGYNDPDQYSIALATAYSRNRAGRTDASFLGVMRKLRTSFFRANPDLSRPEFERSILSRLDGRFKKKEYSSRHRQSPQRLKHQAHASTNVTA